MLSASQMSANDPKRTSQVSRSRAVADKWITPRGQLFLRCNSRVGITDVSSSERREVSMCWPHKTHFRRKSVCVGSTNINI